MIPPGYLKIIFTGIDAIITIKTVMLEVLVLPGAHSGARLGARSTSMEEVLYGARSYRHCRKTVTVAITLK